MSHIEMVAHTSLSEAETEAEAGTGADFKFKELLKGYEHTHMIEDKYGMHTGKEEKEFIEMDKPIQTCTQVNEADTGENDANISSDSTPIPVEHRGITLRQLRAVVANVIRRCKKERWTNYRGDKITPDTATLYDINKYVIMPFTEGKKKSFVESLPSTGGKQTPIWFVSHWWGEPVKDFLSCIEQLVRDFKKRGNYIGEDIVSGGALTDDSPIWCCAYANNQWDLGLDINENPTKSGFAKAMGLAQGTITILDKEGVVFTRVWCSFELYLTLGSSSREHKSKRKKWVVYTAHQHEYQGVYRKENRGAVGIVPGGAISDMDRVHLTNAREKEFPYKFVRKSFKIKVEDSEASVESDRRHILNAMVGRDGEDLNDQPLTSDPKYDEINTAIISQIVSAPSMLKVALRKGKTEWDQSISKVWRGNFAFNIELDFSPNAGWDEAEKEHAIELIENLPVTTKSLTIKSIWFGREVMEKVVSKLNDLNQLVSLNISHSLVGCDSDDDGKECGANLAKMIASNKSITTLELHYTDLIGSRNAKAWSKALKKNRKLKEFKCTGMKLLLQNNIQPNSSFIELPKYPFNKQRLFCEKGFFPDAILNDEGYNRIIKEITRKDYTLIDIKEHALSEKVALRAEMANTKNHEFDHRRAKTTGFADNPANDEDLLNYDLYAEILTEVTRDVEQTKSNFCVGIYSPWGSGKTKLWYLIKDILKKRSEPDNDFVPGSQDSITHYFLFIIFSAVCQSVANFLQWIIYCNDIEYVRLWQWDDETGFSNNDVLVASESAYYETVTIITFICLPFFFPIVSMWYLFFANDNNHYSSSLEEEQPLVLGIKVWALMSGEDTPFDSFSDEVPFSIPNFIRILLIFFIRCICLIPRMLFTCISKCLSCFFTTSNRKIRSHTEDTSMRTQYIPVHFNAWVYNGSDNLWASLMDVLWTKVEETYSVHDVRKHRVSIALSDEKPDDNVAERERKRKSALFRYQIRLILSALLLVTGIITGLIIFDIISIKHVKTKTQDRLELNVIAGFLSFFLTPIPLVWNLFKFFHTVLPQYLKRPQEIILEKATQNLNQRHDFTNETGFMGEVKEEIKFLFDFLSTAKYRNQEKKQKTPIRMCIFVDDLDRCEAQTVVDVLQAVHLLLDSENSHGVTCWLAIDTRIVVASIDDIYSGVLDKAGVTGNDYLEKIVQLPFCIPDLVDHYKKGFIDKFFQVSDLTPSTLLMRMRDIQDLIDNHQDWMEKFSDLKIFNDSQIFLEKDKLIPRKKIIDIFRDFLTILKNDLTVSQHLSNMLSEKDNFLTNDEVVLKQIAKFIQHVYKIEKGTPPPHSDTISEVVSCTDSEDESSSSGNFEDHPHRQPSIRTTHFENGKVRERRHRFKKVRKRIKKNYDGGMSSFVVKSVEKDWLNSLVKFIPGNPRSITRVINVYNVSRSVAEKVNEIITEEHRRKLMKITILAEVWPYRFAWLLKVAEIALLQEFEEKTDKNGNEMQGCTQDGILTLSKAVAFICGKKWYNISLFELYDKLVKVLMYSPDSADTKMSRDGDPHYFELLLKEKEEQVDNHLRISDIMSVNFDRDFNLCRISDMDFNLRAYIFNLQRSLLEDVSNCLERIFIHGDKGADGNRRIKYVKRASYFQVKQGADTN